MKKYDDIIHYIMSYFIKNIRKHCMTIDSYFMTIATKLNQLTSLTQLIKAKEYVKQIPSLITTQHKMIQKQLISLDLLDTLCYKASNELIRLKWLIYHWPSKLYVQLATYHKQIKDEIHYLQLMKKEQELFKNENINEIMIRIDNFHVHNNQIKQHAEILKNAMEINNEISSIIKQAELYNKNEMIFQLDITDYQHYIT